MITIFACSTEEEGKSRIIFLDIPSAKIAITIDTSEQLFTKVGLKDIQLQLKNNSIIELEKAKKIYQNKLKESVQEFNKIVKRWFNPAERVKLKT